MIELHNRRNFGLGLATLPLLIAASRSPALTSEVWTVSMAYDALLSDSARLIDIRSRGEWQETGVGAGIWPISMHDRAFPTRLFAAKDLAGDRTVGLICATGGRSATVFQALRKASYEGYVDVSEGMLGSNRGPGWLSAGLPVVTLDVALASLPEVLG